MPFKPSEVLANLRNKAETESMAEQERLGTAPPRNECTHPPASGVRCTFYKGGKPLHVTYCEECGSIGPAAGTPTLGEWVHARVFRR